jgi:aspartate racemase
MYMALLAAFQVLLRRYTEQDDIIVGSPSAGRSHVNTEGLIGFFVNTLAMRTDLSGNPSFQEVLGRVRTVVLGAHAHQDVPFERLVELLQPERSLGHNPIVQAWFVLMNTQPDDLKLPGLTISSLPTPPGTVKLDLGLTIAQEEKTLTALLEYNTDLFNDETMIQMLNHLSTLLARVVEDPELKVLDIPLGAAPDLHRWSTEDAEAEFLF